MADVEYEEIPVHNPLELPTGRGYRGKQLFKMWGSSGGYTACNVWIWADHFDDAFEELVEYLDDHCPGALDTLGEDELKQAAVDLGLQWKPSWPDWDDPDFEVVAQEAEEGYTVIGHTSLKNGTHIQSDHWGGREADHDETQGVWQACAEAYEEEYGEIPEPPPGIQPPPSQRMLRLRDDLDGLPTRRLRVPKWIKRAR